MSATSDPQQLIERHFLGDLSDQESIELEALLLADKLLRDDFRQAAALDAALRDEALETGSQPEPLPLRQPSFTRHAMRIALAASILLGAGLVTYLLTQQPNPASPSGEFATHHEPLPFIESVERPPVGQQVPVEFDDRIRETRIGSLDSVPGKVMLSNRNAKDQPVVVGHPVRNGDTLFCPPGIGGAVVELADGSLFTLATNTRVTFEQHNDQFQLQLVTGSISADVEPQPTKKPLLLETPNTNVTVLGTVFSLTTCGIRPNHPIPAETRLIVKEGRVSIKSKDADKTLTVGADEMAAVVEGEPFEVINIAALKVGGIEIIRAAYGHNSAWTDATDAIKKRVSSYRVIPTGLFNDLNEDPSFEREKILFVHYKIDGVEGSMEFDEWIVAPRERAATSVTLPLPK